MDCSVTKRRGCNYCIRCKTFGLNSFSFIINEDDKNMFVSYDKDDSSSSEEYIEINYCPICGKEL